MNILIVERLYAPFFRKIYFNNRDIELIEYEKQIEIMENYQFGTGFLYKNNLKKLGNECEIIISNASRAQIAWMKKYCPKKKLDSYNPNLKIQSNEYLNEVLLLQVEYYKPDILFIKGLCEDFCHFFKKFKIKKTKTLIVGQFGLPPEYYNEKYDFFDMIFTCSKKIMSFLKSKNKRCFLLRHGFESSIIENLKIKDRKFDCNFIGGITPAHQDRNFIIDELCKKIDHFNFYGLIENGLEDKYKNISKKNRGYLWGREMYDVLNKTKITINIHIDMSDGDAGNVRTFEATGCGALMITDNKKYINELFDVGKEIICYNNIDELFELIQYYLSHDEERVKIAQAGQKRTLNDHTIQKRMAEFINVVNKYI